MFEEQRKQWLDVVPEKNRPQLNRLIDALSVKLISQENFESQALRCLDEKAAEPEVEGQVARQLAQTNRQNLEPWRVPYDTACLKWEAAMEGDQITIEEARAKLAVKARAKSMTMEEVIYASYLVFSEDITEAHAATMHMLMDVTFDIRIKQHNMYMLRLYPESERVNIAERVVKLRVPLYPPFGELKATNEMMLLDFSHFSEDKTLDERDVLVVAAKYFRTPTQLHGGDYFEPVLDAEGRQISAIRMVGTDARLTQLYAEIGELKKALANSIARGRGNQYYGRSRGGRGSNGYSQQQYRGATAYNTPYRQQYARRGAGGYRGGEPEEDHTAPKNQ